MNKYPKNDNECRDLVITKVNKETNGWQITQDDGWSFWVSADSPVEPQEGMAVRMYGGGNTVRGLFLNGIKVFYRTEAQDKEHHEIQMYGADAADWLKRWDDGKGVWSIEMGGLGPGYEQCIHITCAEILRQMLVKKYDLDQIEKDGTWSDVRDEIDKALFNVPVVKSLGLSGTQYGAAMSLAGQFYRKGPRGVMTDNAVKDRHIQVSRTFPAMAA